LFYLFYLDKQWNERLTLQRFIFTRMHTHKLCVLKLPRKCLPKLSAIYASTLLNSYCPLRLLLQVKLRKFMSLGISLPIQHNIIRTMFILLKTAVMQNLFFVLQFGISLWTLNVHVQWGIYWFYKKIFSFWKLWSKNKNDVIPMTWNCHTSLRRWVKLTRTRNQNRFWQFLKDLQNFEILEFVDFHKIFNF